jgi:hypothetical protein
MPTKEEKETKTSDKKSEKQKKANQGNAKQQTKSTKLKKGLKKEDRSGFPYGSGRWRQCDVNSGSVQELNVVDAGVGSGR